MEITDDMVHRAALAWLNGKQGEHKTTAATRFHKPVRRMLEAALNPASVPRSPTAHSYHSRVKDGACTDCGKPKSEHR